MSVSIQEASAFEESSHFKYGIYTEQEIRKRNKTTIIGCLNFNLTLVISINSHVTINNSGIVKKSGLIDMNQLIPP